MMKLLLLLVNHLFITATDADGMSLKTMATKEWQDAMTEVHSACGPIFPLSRCHKAMAKIDAYGKKTLEHMKKNEYESVYHAAYALRANVKKLSSDDPTEILSGFLDIGASMSEFLPAPAGVALSCIFSVASLLVGEADKPSMSDIVSAAVRQELRTARFDELKDDFSGADLTLSSMKAMLDAAIDEEVLDKMTESDVNYLNAQVQATSGLAVMGKLKSAIRRGLGDLNSYEYVGDIAKAIRLYTRLSVVQFGLMSTARVFYYECEYTKVAHILLESVMKHLETHDKSWLAFLEKPKSEREALVALRILYDEDLETVDYLKAKFGIDMLKSTDLLRSTNFDINIFVQPDEENKDKFSMPVTIDQNNKWEITFSESPKSNAAKFKFGPGPGKDVKIKDTLIDTNYTYYTVLGKDKSDTVAKGVSFYAAKIATPSIAAVTEKQETEYVEYIFVPTKDVCSHFQALRASEYSRLRICEKTSQSPEFEKLGDHKDPLVHLKLILKEAGIDEGEPRKPPPYGNQSTDQVQFKRLTSPFFG